MSRLRLALSTDWYKAMAELKIEPAVLDITMPMAVTNSINYTFTRKDGTPIDISTATILFTVKDVDYDLDSGDATAKIKKELSVTDGPAGKAQLFLTHQETFIAPNDYYYDIKIMQVTSGENTTVDIGVMGRFTITSDRTNRVIGTV